MTSPFEEEGILLVLPGLHPVEDEPGGAHQMALAAVVDLALIVVVEEKAAIFVETIGPVKVEHGVNVRI